MSILTIIEFTDTQVSALIVDNVKEKLSIKAATIINCDKQSDDDAQEGDTVLSGLKEFLKKSKIKAQCPTRIILPKSKVLLRKVVLPSVVDEELEGMARFEAERHIPMNADKQIFGYAVMSKNGMEGSEVLLASAEHSFITGCVEIVRQCSLQLEAVWISPLALFNSMKQTVDDFETKEAIMSLNLGYDNSDFSIYSNGQFVMTRGTGITLSRLFEEFKRKGLPDSSFAINELDAIGSIPDDALSSLESQEQSVLDSYYYPSFSETGESDTEINDTNGTIKHLLGRWLSAIVKDVNRTSDFAKREFATPAITNIYITGRGAGIPRISNYLRNSLGIKVEVFNPYMKTEDKNLSIADTDRLAFSMPICAAYNTETISINMIPKEYIEAGRKQRQKKSWIVTGIMAVILLVGLYVLVSMQFNQKTELLSVYTSQNKAMKSEVDDLNNKNNRLKIIKEFTKDEHGALEILEFLSSSSMFPTEITMSEFDFKKGDSVKLKGNARSIAGINRYANELEGTGFFDKVVQESGSMKQTLLPNRSESCFEYVITASFVQPKGAKKR